LQIFDTKRRRGSTRPESCDAAPGERASRMAAVAR
jgi:hypothetical protein